MAAWGSPGRSDTESEIEGFLKDDGVLDAESTRRSNSSGGAITPEFSSMIASVESKLRMRMDAVEALVQRWSNDIYTRIEACEVGHCAGQQRFAGLEDFLKQLFEGATKLENDMTSRAQQIEGLELRIGKLEGPPQQPEGSRGEISGAIGGRDISGLVSQSQALQEQTKATAQSLKNFLTDEAAKIAGLSDVMHRMNAEQDELRDKIDQIWFHVNEPASPGSPGSIFSQNNRWDADVSPGHSPTRMRNTKWEAHDSMANNATTNPADGTFSKVASTSLIKCLEKGPVLGSTTQSKTTTHKPPTPCTGERPRSPVRTHSPRVKGQASGTSSAITAGSSKFNARATPKIECRQIAKG